MTSEIVDTPHPTPHTQTPRKEFQVTWERKVQLHKTMVMQIIIEMQHEFLFLFHKL
jgi:hypothetical protein